MPKHGTYLHIVFNHKSWPKRYRKTRLLQANPTIFTISETQ
jgi:hypothetical protein